MTLSPPFTEDMLELSDIYPFWRGARVPSIRAPLLAGIAAAQATLAGSNWVVLSMMTSFDYDTTWETIGDLIATENREAGAIACGELLARRTSELLAANPSWSIIGDPVLPRSVLPATRTVLHGDPLPVAECSVKVGNTVMYESTYVRCYVCSAEGPSDPLTNLLTNYASEGFGNINDAFVSYLTQLGRNP